MIEPRCLINEESRAPLFQGSFVGHGKRFHGAWVHPEDEARDNSTVLQQRPFSKGPIVAIVDSSHCET
jgi:hypothetical protein